MLASVHLVDTDARTALRVLRRAPEPTSVPGLRSARVALANPLRTSFAPKPAFGRVGLIAFWDDEASLDAFESDNAQAKPFADGWRVRLEPLRAYGSWPGLDRGISHARKIDDDGPAAVLTLGRLHLTRTLRFLRTSAKAEAAAVDAPGLIWATAMARPPFLATCSLWADSDAIAAYAFDDENAGHPSAIRADRAKPFHHESAFIRFHPYAVAGSLPGKNPLPEGALGAMT